MKSFAMPEFYLPHPARLNPHLDYAREHAAAWGERLDIVNETGSVWSRDRYDRMEIALLCAYAHPDCDAAALALITEWYVWVLFFDDDFLTKFKNTGRRGPAREYLDRHELFLVEPGVATPEPANPSEAGLADCWARTIPAMSPQWRRRMATSTHNLMIESLWELDNIARGRVANPIEYIEMRRRVGGAPWSANLVEYAVGGAVPERFVGARPLRVLCDSFSDGVHLRNDLFSYEREVRTEGENANAVLVLQRFLRLPVQGAANLVNDMITSRLKQFEDTALVETPRMCVEQAATAAEQRAVAAYTSGLQDWQAGGHEWHLRSSRYSHSGMPSGPTGLGTGHLLPGMRMQVNQHVMPPREPGRLEIHGLSMPYAARINPHIAAARAALLPWATVMGLLDPATGWSPDTLADTDFAGYAARIFPEANAADLVLRTQWCTWGTYADDLYSRTYRGNPVAGRAQLRRLAGFTEDAPDPPLTPLERGLADLWQRTTHPSFRHVLDRNPHAGTAERLRTALARMFTAWEAELDNEVRGRIPDPIDYLETRRAGAGGEVLSVLGETDRTEPIPPELLDTSVLRQLDNSAFDHAALVNDLYSYEKEIWFDSEHHNLVYVTQSFLGCSREAARDIVVDLVDERMRQFEHSVREDLPAFFDDHEVSAAARAAVLGHIDRLRALLAGNLVWHNASARYRAAAPWDRRIRVR